ncbi:MAG: Trm112 family protein [bacterium]
MSLDDELLDILVCPESKEPLIYFEEEEFLFSPDSQLKYPIKDEIPVMLVDEAEEVDEQETERLLQQAEENDLLHTNK